MNLASHIALGLPGIRTFASGARFLTILLLLPKILGPKLVFTGQLQPFRTGPLRPVRLDPVGELEMLGHLELPNGTVTLNLDRDKGIMDVFTEQEPHPSDWAITAQIIKLLCCYDDMGEPDRLKGIDTWRIQLKPDRMAVQW